MNESPKVVAGPPAGAPVAPGVAVNAPAVVAAGAPPSQPPAAFGGHRGGGKKRADGLPAGSPAAIEADKKKDRERKANKALEKKNAALPPPLPGVASSPANAPQPLANGASPVPAPVAGVAAVAAPTFVAWGQKQLERPAKLLTKIADRFRVWQLSRKVSSLKLPSAVEKEVLAELPYKDEVLADFQAALAECAAVEFNKRRLAGAGAQHWTTLGLCAGELLAVHLQTMDRLEKLAAENRKTDLTAKNAENAKP